uniref:Uncharacterized protein n=1 Tax=Arundo donax TaxID=35708 RepID=A0A0A9DDX4_ARUDO
MFICMHELKERMTNEDRKDIIASTKICRYESTSTHRSTQTEQEKQWQQVNNGTLTASRYSR